MVLHIVKYKSNFRSWNTPKP